MLNKKIIYSTLLICTLNPFLFAEDKKINDLTRTIPIEKEVSKEDIEKYKDKLTSYEIERIEKYNKYKEKFSTNYNINFSNYNVELEYKNVIKDFFNLISDSDNTFQHSYTNSNCNYNLILDDKNTTILEKSFFDCEIKNFNSKNLIVNLDKKYDTFNVEKIKFVHLPKTFETIEKDLLESALILNERKKFLFKKIRDNNNSLIPENKIQELSFKDGNKIIKRNLYDYLNSIQSINLKNMEYKIDLDYLLELNIDELNILDFNNLLELFLYNNLEYYKEPKIINFKIINPKINISKSNSNYQNFIYFKNKFDIEDLNSENYFSNKYLDFFKYLKNNFLPNDKLDISGNIKMKLLTNENIIEEENSMINENNNSSSNLVVVSNENLNKDETLEKTKEENISIEKKVQDEEDKNRKVGATDIENELENLSEDKIVQKEVIEESENKIIDETKEENISIEENNITTKTTIVNKKKEIINYINFEINLEISHPKIGNIYINSNMFINAIDLKLKTSNSILDDIIIQNLNMKIDSSFLKKEFENYLVLKEKKLRKDNLKNSFRNEWKKEFLKLNEFLYKKNNIFDEKEIRKHILPLIKFEKENVSINFININSLRTNTLKEEIKAKYKNNQSLNGDLILFLNSF